MIAAAEILTQYAIRACFLCGTFGPCPHREFDIEAAYIAASEAKSDDKEGL